MVVSAPVGPYDDLHIVIKRDQKMHQAFDRKVPGFTAQHLGYVGLAETK